MNPDRRAIIDTQNTLRAQRSLQPCQRQAPQFGMAAIQRTDTHGKGKIEPWLPRLRYKVLNGALPKFQPPACKLHPRTGNGLRHSLGRAVDRNNFSGSQHVCHEPGRHPWPASDFQDMHIGPQRQCGNQALDS